MPLLAGTNAPYPNRIQLKCGLFTGPFTSAALGAFDPAQDMEVCIAGNRLSITSFSFDANNNRYLLYTHAPFNLRDIIQVVHHMPNPPFHDAAFVPQTLPGFALVASFSPDGDENLTPSISIKAVPNPAVHDTPVNLFWTSFNVANVRITGTAFDTGFLSTVGSGIFPVPGGFPSTVILTIEGYDSSFNPILIGFTPLTASTTLVIT